MANGNETNLFDSLKNLGFDGLSGISLYENPQEQKQKPKAVNTVSPESFVFDRKVECPVCYRQISVPAVKSSSVRVLNRDSDFMTYYGDPNPMFYDAWICPQCGYAALSTKFTILTDKQKKLVKDNISARWKSGRTYPQLHTVDVAIEKHQLALLNAVVKCGRDSEKAMTCLKLAWLYRIKKDSAQELKFLDQARLGFIRALEKEPSPIAGLDEPSLEYLIGELYRRMGDTSNALLWFSRVLSNRMTKPKIKDMARDQKEIIKAQQG